MLYSVNIKLTHYKQNTPNLKTVFGVFSVEFLSYWFDIVPSQT